MRWFIKLEFIMDRRGASTSIYNTDKWSKWRAGHFNKGRVVIFPQAFR
jgi:hypothetical protein